MNLADLFIAKKLAGGGGGGTGTDNYNDLSNKPQINSTALTGDKSASDLGLQSEIDSDNKISADYVDDTSASNKFVSAAEKLAWSGKQDAIDADHKIDADYVDDTTSDNKFVTASDKTAWNAKQNAIDSSHKLSSDLVDDTGHTNLFVTSTEKSTWTGKQDKIDSSHKLSSTLVSFDSSEAAALASGIDSTKVSQIATNQTNILSVQDAAKELADKGAKNLLPKLKSYTDSGLSMVINDDNSITAKWSATGGSTTYARINDNNWTLPRGTYVLSGMPNTNNIGCYIHIETNTSQLVVEQERKTPVEFTIANDYEYLKIYISIRPNSAAETSGVTILPMIVTKAISDIGADSYVPPALPNYDLTRLESEDRAGLIECVDGGAKNILQYDVSQLKPLNTSGTWNGNAYTINGVTYTVNSDMTITTSGTATGNANLIIYNPPSNTSYSKPMIISGCPDGGNYYTSYSIYVCDQSASTIVSTADSNGVAIPINTNFKYIAILIRQGANATGKTFKPMICTKAAFDISPKFVPFTLKQPRVISKKVDATVSITETILTDFTFTVPAKHIAEISVMQHWANATPRLIRIATNNTMTDDATIAYVEESTKDFARIQAYGIFSSGDTDKTVYVSAKSSSQAGASNAFYLLVKLYSA